ncbi:MAG: caspase family protein, partial [Planctomycetaceae bacterium]|nr:caspase family protein [Planctomycetaceae bacterium]
PELNHPAEDENGIERHLFFLGMGIAQHKYEEYNLNFCDHDVEAVADALKKQQGKLYSRVHSQVYTDEQATRDNLETGLNWVADGCKAEDTVVIMFAGHGLKARRGLYYLPYDGDFESLAATCLNWDKVGEALRRCRAKKILFLSDACHAGAFGKSLLPLQEDLVNGLVKSAGVMVLASSTGTEESFEVDNLRHGVFTATLLKGLAGHGDSNKDQQVTLGELADYVIAEVPAETQRLQHPCIPDVGTFDRDLILSHVAPASPEDEPANATPAPPQQEAPSQPKAL